MNLLSNFKKVIFLATLALFLSPATLKAAPLLTVGWFASEEPLTVDALVIWLFTIESGHDPIQKIYDNTDPRTWDSADKVNINDPNDIQSMTLQLFDATPIDMADIFIEFIPGADVEVDVDGQTSAIIEAVVVAVPETSSGVAGFLPLLFGWVVLRRRKKKKAI